MNPEIDIFSFIFNFQLQATEEKVSKLEECDCTKSCQLPGGIIREDGASWSEGCQLCSCVVSSIILYNSLNILHSI